MRVMLWLIVARLCVHALFSVEVAFGLTNIWTIEIQASPGAWNVITTSRDFTHADIRLNEQTYTNVDLRQKGGGTSGGTQQSRPPLRLVFKGRSVAGVKKLSLNNNFFDTSYLRDVLSYKLCNDFGVVAPRTAFAKVYLKTPAREQATYLGLYTVTEIVDETFVREHFNTFGGLVMKPNHAGSVSSDRWSDYEQRLEPKTVPSKGEQDRMIAFMKLVNESSNAVFEREIVSYIDPENYLRFIVVNVALSNLDSYLAMGKNYYLYLHPKTGKLTWIPWDFDLSFGGFFLCGTPDQRIRLSIEHPLSVDDRLFTRLMAMPEVKKRYLALMREFMDKHFQVASIEQQIDQLAKVIEPAVMEERRDRAAAFKLSLDGRPDKERGRRWFIDVGLKQFVEGRVSSIEEQLAGRSKGERPRFGR